MEKNNKIELFSFLGVMLLATIGVFTFWGLQGHVAVDSGREFYIPEQMLGGQVLYKDIFNIYGAFAYQINMVLYKLFGANTLTLHVFGNIVGLGIIALIYLSARQFLDRFYSILVAVVSIIIGIFKMEIFNYTVPYSFAVIYGMFCALISFYLMCSYYKNDDKKYLYYSVFFAGVAFALKYDFAPFLLVYPVICCIKKESVKTFIKLILIGLIIPVLSIGAVFLAGFGFNDFLVNIDLFRRISQAPSLTSFYQETGVYLTLNNFFFKPLFYYIGIVSLALFLVKSKKIFLDKYYFVVLLALFLLSTKSLFICNLKLYGIYSAPFLLMALILILSRYYFVRFKYLKVLIVFLCVGCFFNSLIKEFNYKNLYSMKIKTDKGWISTASEKSSSKLLVDIILNKTEKTDKIVILPEGHMINFLTDRMSDNFYGNLIPMYVEAFGEDVIINHYKKNKPEYFILTDRDTSEYGKQYICTDYAQNLCSWILENYHVVYKIDGEPQYLVLRKN